MRALIARGHALAALFLSLLLLASCEPQDATPEVPANDTIEDTTAVLLKQGAWSGAGGYRVSGVAQLHRQGDGSLLLVLDDFSSSNGPDLKVYLSADERASSFLSLGPLKSVAGTQVYPLPAGTDPDRYPFALIWCERFSVLFGRALLE